MALETGLGLQSTQKLILTPRLQQAIKLLQMPRPELSQTLNDVYVLKTEGGIPEGDLTNRLKVKGVLIQAEGVTGFPDPR